MTRATVSDVPAERDSIGYEPYVLALATFLKNEHTKPPLTISVEGEWGAGKSSFLLQLAKAVEKSDPTDPHSAKDPNITIVEFNAWRHDKDQALWAAFVLSFIEQLSPRWSRPIQRIWLNLKLWFLRYDWQRGWFAAARFLAGLILLIGLTAFLSIKLSSLGANTKGFRVDDWADYVIGIGGAVGYVFLALYCWNKLKELIGNPLSIDLQAFVSSPQYAGKVSFIESLRKDFKKVVDVYAHHKKVFVLVDDLDRCEIPRAADLMQALNLLTSFELDNVIFVLAMDRRKVAAGIAAKYATVLPYIYLGSDPNDSAGMGLRFGYEFIEKFVQLPFRLPRPATDNIDELLDDLGFEERQSSVPRHAKKPNPSEQFRLVERSDSATLRDIVSMVTPVLDFNPRRIKGFINSFRLSAFIAYRTRALESSDDGSKKALTLEQLAKITAVICRWPTILANTDSAAALIRSISAKAANRSFKVPPPLRKAVNEWLSDEKLRALMAFGVPEERYSLTGIDIDKLLQVAPFAPAHSFDRNSVEQSTSSKAEEDTHGSQGQGASNRKRASRTATSRKRRKVA